MRMTRWLATAAFGALAVSGGAVKTAAAQEAGSDTTVADVVVTATKRDVGVQELPASVTAVTAERLDALNAQSLADYFRTVPGLMVNSTGAGANRLDFSLRGISDFSALAPTQNVTVGQYLDEVPVTAVGQQLDPRLIDIERVEVLRGPQGTFFGSGALGGAIRLITRKPDLEAFSGYVEGRVSDTSGGGRNDSGALVVNLPIVRDRLAVRAMVFDAFDSGFVDSVDADCPRDTTGCTVRAPRDTDINKGRSSGGRIMALAEPTDRLSILAEYVRGESRSRNAALYEPRVGDLLIRASSSTNTITRDESDLYNITARLDLGWAELVTSSSWGERVVATEVQAGAGPMGPQSGGGVQLGYVNFTQEVRLVSSPSWSERWDYVLGGFYADEKRDTGSTSSAGFQELGRAKDHAVFGELGLKVDRRLSVRGGLRVERVDVDSTTFKPSTQTISARNTPTTGRLVVDYRVRRDAMAYASLSTGFRRGGVNPLAVDRLTGKAVPGVPDIYKPDRTRNYEVGVKLSWPQAQAHLNLAAYHIDWKDIQAAGIAQSAQGPVQFFQNAGRAKVDGVEVEGAIELLPGLEAQGTLYLSDPRMAEDSLLPSDLPSGFVAPAYCSRGCPARAGDTIPFTAKAGASLTIEYRRPLASGVTGFVVLNEQFTGKRNTDFAAVWTGPGQSDVLACPFQVVGRPCPVPLRAVPRTRTGDANAAFRTMERALITNLQLGVTAAGWRVAAYADNLLDERTQTIIAAAGQGGPDQVLVGRPRTVGLFVRRGF